MPPKHNSADLPPAGPEASFNLRFFKNIYSELIAQLLVRYPLFARDAAHSAFVIIQTRKIALEEKDNPLGFVFQLAINEAKSLYRGSTRSGRLVVDTDLAVEAAPPVHGDIGAALISAEEIAAAFAQLTDLEQRVYEMKLEHQLPTHEIAKRLHITHNRAKRALTRARQLMQASISNTPQGRRK